jgi:ankyrin repeat protein
MLNDPAVRLFNACCRGDAAAVSRLIPAGGTHLNLSGPRYLHEYAETTPLMVAAEGGHTAIVRMILERALNTTVDNVDVLGGTALLKAATFHRADIVRLLAGRGRAVRLTPGRRGPRQKPGWCLLIHADASLS